MDTNVQPIYQRVLLKLSGEALQGKKKFGIDPDVLNRITLEIKTLVESDVQVGIVIGGGNIFRGEGLAKVGISRLVGDHIGMLATAMNGLAIFDALHQINVNAHLMSAVPLNSICENYSCTKATSLLCKNCVVIFVAGTGNPFFTTDSAACLRGIEIKANIVLKATKVDGIYSNDPIKQPNSILYHQISYKDVLKQNLSIMDVSALFLARDYDLPIRVFNINKPGALQRVILSNKEGTLITH